MTLHQIFQKTIVILYRFAAQFLLYGALSCAAAYVVWIGFYFTNHSWVVPFIVTPTNDKILDLTAKVVTSEETLRSLELDRNRLNASMGDMKLTLTALQRLDINFQHAIADLKVANTEDAPDLTSLNVQKHQDNIDTQDSLKQITEIDKKIDMDLKAGLITQGDAAVAKTQIRASLNAATDGKIGEILLRDNVREKNSSYTTTVDALAKEAELNSNIVQLSILVNTGEQQLSTDLLQIKQLSEAVDTAKNSPYFLATQGNIKFAFVPYDNQEAATVNRPVYGCWLNMVICHRVGVVKKVFSDEEKTLHPVFRTDLRGFLIQLELTDEAAAKDKSLFIGGKPLIF